MVGVGEWAVDAGEQVLVAWGLGPSVAVALYDPVPKAGALVHLLLPSPNLGRDRSNPGRFPETALPRVVAELESLGARRDRLTARIVGGASLFGPASAAMGIGERNVQASRQVLGNAHIPVVGEDVLERHGRSVVFHLEDGRVDVRTVAHGTVTL